MTKKINSYSGFTILEVLVSLSIFSISSLGLAKCYANQITLNNLAERRSSAVFAVQQALDRLRTVDPSTLPTTGSTTENITIGPRTFSVVTKYCVTAGTCSSASVRGLTVEAYMRGDKIFEVETVFSQLR